MAAEPFRPASEPLALLYRILGPGARPSRHSRGTVAAVRRTCYTRGFAPLDMSVAGKYTFDCLACVAPSRNY